LNDTSTGPLATGVNLQVALYLLAKGLLASVCGAIAGGCRPAGDERAIGLHAFEMVRDGQLASLLTRVACELTLDRLRSIPIPENGDPVDDVARLARPTETANGWRREQNRARR